MKLTTEEINALNLQAYNTIPDQWLRFPFSNILPGWIKTHVPTPTGRKALDIGSGNGILAEWLQKEGFQVLCIDPSEEMVRRCKARKLTTIQTTIQEYQPKELFDAVFAVCCLLHVPKSDFPNQLKKIASCLKPGGFFICTFIEGSSEAIEEFEQGFPRFFARYQKEELLPLLEKDFQFLEYAKTLRTPVPDRSYLLFAFQRR